MTNRKLDAIARDKNPLTLASSDSVQRACQQMWKRRVGATPASGTCRSSSRAGY
jgi:hypothetical protein